MRIDRVIETTNIKEEIMTKPTLEENVKMLIDLALKQDGRMDRMEKRFDRLEDKVDGIEKRFDGVEHSLGGLEQRMDRMEGDIREIKALLNK